MKSVLRSVKNVALQYEDIEVKVREATSSDKWGATSTQMAEIARATFNYAEYPKLFAMLWKRLNDQQHLLHVQKALLLTEYLLRHGAERFITDAKRRARDVARLRKYKFYDKTNNDVAGDARVKANHVYELLTNDALLAKERKKAESTRDIRNQAFSNTSYGGASAQPHRSRQQSGYGHASSRNTHQDRWKPVHTQAQREPARDSARARAPSDERKHKKEKKKKHKHRKAAEEDGPAPPTPEAKKKKKKKDKKAKRAKAEAAAAAAAPTATVDPFGTPSDPTVQQTASATDAYRAQAAAAPVDPFGSAPAPIGNVPATGAPAVGGGIDLLTGVAPVPVTVSSWEDDFAGGASNLQKDGNWDPFNGQGPPPVDVESDGDSSSSDDDSSSDEDEEEHKDDVWSLANDFTNLDNLRDVRKPEQVKKQKEKAKKPQVSMQDLLSQRPVNAKLEAAKAAAAQQQPPGGLGFGPAPMGGAAAAPVAPQGAAGWGMQGGYQQQQQYPYQQQQQAYHTAQPGYGYGVPPQQMGYPAQAPPQTFNAAAAFPPVPARQPSFGQQPPQQQQQQQQASNPFDGLGGW